MIYVTSAIGCMLLDASLYDARRLTVSNWLVNRKQRFKGSIVTDQLSEIRATFPGWQCWQGDLGGMLYARTEASRPRALIRSDSPEDLAAAMTAIDIALAVTRQVMVKSESGAGTVSPPGQTWARRELTAHASITWSDMPWPA